MSEGSPRPPRAPEPSRAAVPRAAPRSRSRRPRSLLRIGAAFLGGAVLASGAWWARGSGPASGWVGWASAGAAQEIPPQDVRPLLELSEAFVRIAEASTPAVVRIEARLPARLSQRRGLEIPEPFREFFDLPSPQERQGPREAPPQFAGGTGFVVSGDGTILTNAHVVAQAEEITVHLENRRSYPARLVGLDPTTDVAVLDIDAPGLPTLPLGRSSSVRVGEWIMAIGNPGLGGAGSALDYTVTSGIISAVGRPLQLLQRELLEDPERQALAGYAIENFLQTDAVINPGNSGGPMINLRGQVVGINAAIASRTGFYQGYGFAIPIDLARRVMEDLLEFGEVRRGILGVQISDVTPEDAEAFGLPAVAGVLVQGVQDDSPAEEADLEMGDVIVAVGGRPVDRVNQLQQAIAERRPGEEVTLTLFRERQRLEVEVELGAAPAVPAAPAAPARGTAPEPVGSELGLVVQDLDPGLAQEMGYRDSEGAVVVDVQPWGPAGRAGIAPGLRIVEIGDEDIDDADEVREVLGEAAPGSVVSFILEDPAGDRRIVNVRKP